MDEHLEAFYPGNSRFDEIEQILNYIRRGNSVQIVSIPGVGRSNLLGLLAYNRSVRIKHLEKEQTGYHFVNINLSEVKNRPTSDVFKFIFLELLDSLKERKVEQEYVSKVLKESILLNDEMVIFQGLKKTIEYLTLEKNLTIIFLFDRFETFIQTATPGFFSNLRILRNKAKYKFACVFSLNKTLEETFEKETLGDFFEFVAGHIVYLQIYDAPGVGFRIKYLEQQTGKKIPTELFKKIMEQTGGHGKLTRVCLEYYLNTKKEDFLNDKAVEAVLYGIEKSLSPSDLEDLKNKQSLRSGELKKTNEYLENIQLLKNGQITIPLFEEFLNKRPPKPANINYDNLTSSEFRLLKFLEENQNRIIEREEVISNVWSEGKSTEGVSDEALDQLISRLRKKIEVEPNSPTHLQTIKGRGFKFVT